MITYEDPEQVKQFEEHLATCEDCKAAASQRQACARGKALHEAMVLRSHARRRAEATT